MSDLRKKAAEDVERFYRGEIGLLDIMAIYDKCEDKEINELIDLVVHEPKAGGWFGMKPDDYKKYMAEISALIAKLKTESI